MNKQRYYAYLFLILLILSQYIPIVICEENEPQPIKNLLRGMQIEFNPPDLVQDCGSLFDLQVNLTKYRCLPTIFSISVFFKIENEYGKEMIYRIGMAPYVYIPPLHRLPVTINITCFTNKDFIERFYCLEFNKRENIEYQDAQIGVKIDTVGHWGISGILWQCFINNGFKLKNMFLRYNEQFYLNLFLEKGMTRPIRYIRFLSIFQQLNSVCKRNNPLIVWEDTTVIPGLICSKEIKIENTTIDNQTNSDGYFNVTYNISNNLNEDLPALITIDISDTPIYNSLVPLFHDKFYNVGYQVTLLPAHETITDTILCEFPNDSMFYEKNYSVYIECIPYNDIDNMSQFGILFYDIRWKIFIRSYYIVDQEVQDAVKTAWYNLPIHYGDPTTDEIFTTDHGIVEYQGDSPDSWRDVINTVNTTVEHWIYLLLMASALLIGLFFIGYWIIRRIRE